MKDKNGVTIEKGHLIKRCGYVQYADGKRYKTSKKTWLVDEVKDDVIYYLDAESHQTPLKRPKDEGEFLVVGDENGYFNEYKSTTIVLEGSVPQKYRVLKDIKSEQWKAGDVVQITGKVSSETLEKGILEQVSDDTPHQHVKIVVDTILVGKAVKNIQNG